MNQVYLLIGGNLNNRLELLAQAKESIVKDIGSCIMESSVYESEPWGFLSDQNFLNQVLILNTKLEPIEVLNESQKIENKLGRLRKSTNYSSRTMDIDLLFYNNEIINNPRLTVPHEHLYKRRFTLEPLVELTPDFMHPVFEKSLAKLLIECSDKSVVKKL
ncbi:MAG: 2-amino-4-hydroxy-6-hydroxymethyldihydropteridine diphosphokinase [Bacteroidales bacterium]|nr:2-amino-4-hydroxy-6-hydroxymethyldihydropteridine diphosphokinase [Bacteroidales bacterium]